jgi:hypothetical protein
VLNLEVVKPVSDVAVSLPVAILVIISFEEMSVSSAVVLTEIPWRVVGLSDIDDEKLVMSFTVFTLVDVTLSVVVCVVGDILLPFCTSSVEVVNSVLVVSAEVFLIVEKTFFSVVPPEKQLKTYELRI